MKGFVKRWSLLERILLMFLLHAHSKSQQVEQSSILLKAELSCSASEAVTTHTHTHTLVDLSISCLICTQVQVKRSPVRISRSLTVITCATWTISSINKGHEVLPPWKKKPPTHSTHSPHVPTDCYLAQSHITYAGKARKHPHEGETAEFWEL